MGESAIIGVYESSRVSTSHPAGEIQIEESSHWKITSFLLLSCLQGSIAQRQEVFLAWNFYHSKRWKDSERLAPVKGATTQGPCGKPTLSAAELTDPSRLKPDTKKTSCVSEKLMVQNPTSSINFYKNLPHPLNRMYYVGTCYSRAFISDSTVDYSGLCVPYFHTITTCACLQIEWTQLWKPLHLYTDE